jgi:hypothetical protein
MLNTLVLGIILGPSDKTIGGKKEILWNMVLSVH